MVQPIETVKVRLQNNGGTFSSQLKSIIKNESVFSALWRGSLASSARELSYSTLRFGLYSPIKKALAPLYNNKKGEPLWSKILAGGLAGGIGSAIATPLDLLKTRAQASQVPVSTTELARSIIRSDGLAGLWRGMSTTVSRAVIIGSVKLATYDEVKLSLAKVGFTSGSGEQIVTAAIVTGLMVSLASAPIDFARTRFMSGTLPNGERYRSGFHVLRTIRPKTAMYTGAGASWSRIAPYTILQFFFWEKLCGAFNIKAV